ncbi:hypothetical protein QE152_g33146 [Popillia japonica]|uniref:Uncharacterized protein n=1 Tax=Popillia japonica TaxID=7064 RepID=A0AAW1IXR1_POPJA
MYYLPISYKTMNVTEMAVNHRPVVYKKPPYPHYGDKKVKQQNLLTFFSIDKDNLQEKDDDGGESFAST